MNKFILIVLFATVVYCHFNDPFVISEDRFTPKYSQCLFHNDDPLLQAGFKNYLIYSDTYYPHGSEIVTRCRQFGLYKLTGESTLRCKDGFWSSKLPRCVPTSFITNYTNGAPPTIQYRKATGLATVDLTGELHVYPGSTIWLDCIWPKYKGEPLWSWNQSYAHHASWSRNAGETDFNYRLVLSHVSSHDSGIYTCTSPTGSTNSVTIKVVNITSSPINASSPHVHHLARLGNAVCFSCQPVYQLNGFNVFKCMGDGRWSSQPQSCPVLRGGTRSVVEYYLSYRGGDVF